MTTVRDGAHVASAGTHVPAEVTDLVAAWAPGRRWYPGGVPGLATPWLEVTFDGADDVVVALLLLGTTVLQVPLVVRPKGRGNDDTDPGYIGTAAGLAVHDGGVHPAAWVAYVRAAGLDPDVSDGRAIAGEQSNTSVVLPRVRPDGAAHGAMLKILRTVAGGAHPDVVVPQALTAAGFSGTPRYLGDVELPPVPQLLESTHHLAVLAALVPEARDGFELACEHARAGEPFDALAAELGDVVARLHATLREALPTPVTLDPSAFVAGLRLRADAAVEAAPALAPHADAIRHELDDLQSRLTPVPLQRIHGDLHLGQALYGADGWQLLDFEGEPQRPVSERTAPDLPLRDVAGVLRSFDYAAAVGGAQDPAWAARAQTAFRDAYRAASGGMVDDAVLRALVLDKALYEVVYETRQRPQWVPIPLRAVERLLAE
ncbi:phosphotransferase [Xylanimonas sp. McL0601]|uniref:phosphotransferase n=1 Tax=Xylanimonas sp. McL0601 TaxID=3414739 RepID=UPI003CEFDF51